jgi:hypothetical protein
VVWQAALNQTLQHPASASAWKAAGALQDGPRQVTGIALTQEESRVATHGGQQVPAVRAAGKVVLRGGALSGCQPPFVILGSQILKSKAVH